LLLPDKTATVGTGLESWFAAEERPRSSFIIGRCAPHPNPEYRGEGVVFSPRLRFGTFDDSSD
jgi:hypothetical protein